MIGWFATATLLQIIDFEAGDGGLQDSGSSGQWEYGEITVGPPGMRSGWATQVDRSYLNDAYDVLEVPLPDLSSTTLPQVEVEHWFHILTGDAGSFEVLEPEVGEWRRIEPVYGYSAAAGFQGESGGWIRSVIDMTGLAENTRLRFAFGSDLTGAAAGWYISSIAVYDGDVAPPKIEPVLSPEDTQDWTGPYPVQVNLWENQALTSSTLEWRVDAGETEVLELENLGDSLYGANIPGQLPETGVEWRIRASDGEAEVVWPETGWSAFRVFLAAPQNMAMTDERHVAQTVPLRWEAPDTPHGVEGYVVYQGSDGGAGIRCPQSPCVVPVEPTLDLSWTVRARYVVDGSEMEGDPSETVVGDVYVPEIESLRPNRVAPGDRIWVEVSGEYLLLTESVEVELGDGLDVTTIRVFDTNRMEILVDVDSAAQNGLRTLTIDGESFMVFPDVFEVSSGLFKPHIDTVTPDQLPQGLQGQVVICPSEPFAGEVTLSSGDGLIQVDAPRMNTDTGCVEVTLAAQFSAPAGVRTLLLDDGARLWPFDFRIQKTLVRTGSACHSAPLSPMWVALIPVWLRLRRRR